MRSLFATHFLTLPLLLAPTLDAQSLTTQRVATGLANPTFCTSPPGDYERLFITEQYTGRVRILKNGALLPTPFLDIDANVTNSGNERGLLGMAFHPDYENNGFFYVSYINNGGFSLVRRYTVSSNDPDVADPSTALNLFRIPQDFENHNGGMIAFGPDGYLYFGLGDGGSGNDPRNRSQTQNTLLGKMLRVDVDGGTPYAIPPSNPFRGSGGFADEVWAYGLRNPWRFCFDRGTGDMYIADVGQNAREEISFQPASSAGGENYGWRCMEGTRCTGLSGCTCNSPSLVMPIHEYSHGDGRSITGGYVYRGCSMPWLQGTYFFADYTSSRIWSFRYDGTTKTEFRERTAELRPNSGAINTITSFGEDGLGEIYLCDRGGEIWKIVEGGPGGVDCNGNGRADLCDIRIGSSLDLNVDGIPDECQALSADTAEISVTSGGTQRLQLQGDAADSGRPYLLLGSTSGTTPGTTLGSIVLPLNFDSYTILSAQYSNTPVFVNTASTLGASGAASASLVLPPGLAELAGARLYHAWILTSPTIDFTSNYITLDLVM